MQILASKLVAIHEEITPSETAHLLRISQIVAGLLLQRIAEFSDASSQLIKQKKGTALAPSYFERCN
jgi:hypothetical protein